MRRTIEIVLVLLGGIAVVAWLCRPDIQFLEPLAALFGTTSIFSLVDLFWPRPTEAERDEKRKRRNQEYRTALDRIEQEWNHLEGMDENPARYAGKTYAEATAFELIEQDLAPLTKYWGLRGSVNKALAEVKRNATLPEGKKDVHLLVKVLTNLRTMLLKHLE